MTMTAAEFRAARLALSLSQLRLAQELGVVRTTIAYWEHDVRPVPRAVELAMKYLAGKT